jgi:hypothetical protein
MGHRILVFGLFAVALMFQAGPGAWAGELSEWDAAGNRYPAACRRDLSDVAAPVVKVLSGEALKALWRAVIGTQPPDRLYGFVLTSTLPRPVVYVDGSLRPAMIEATIRHERCHLLWNGLTGSWHWHPPYQGELP